MLFNSLVFLAFAVVFYAVWHLLRRQGHRLLLLVVASFLFYSYWDWRYLFLLVGSGLIDYGAALGMEARPARRRLFLLLSLGGNVGSLACFKYSGFALDSATSIFSLFGLQLDLSGLDLSAVIPLGISFYTFQSMSYTIDVYRGRLRPTRSPLHFFAYLAMFPQLVAGPIERAVSLLPQLEKRRTPDARCCWESWGLLCRGYFKKCVIADNLVVLVNQSFDHPGAFAAGLYWWLVMAMFAMVIYTDFSGYSDIARGLAGLMGIELMVNFDHPYLSRSFAEFWRRWHISLSSWFRDYVYIPLGGNRRGALRTYVNIWITMLVSGLWHGAAWTFVAWGAWHAAWLSLEKMTDWPARLARLGMPGSVLSWAVVLSMTLVSWVFFRADSLTEAWVILGVMFSPAALALDPLSTVPGSRVALAQALAILALSVAWMGYWAVRDRLPDRVLPGPWRVSALTPLGYALAALAAVYFRGPGSDFVYFQF